MRRIIASAGFMLAVTAARADAVAPSVRCEAGKNQALGKYVACLQKAEQRYVAGGATDVATRADAILKCEERYSGSWTKLETKATPGVCPREGDASQMRDFMTICAEDVQDAIGGGVLPTDLETCGQSLSDCEADNATCPGELASCQNALPVCEGDLADCHEVLDPIYDDWWTCWQPLNTFEFEVCRQKLAICESHVGLCEQDVASCASDCSATQLSQSGQTTSYGTSDDGDLELGAPAAFTDNGDGTITDANTALMWEKKISTSVQKRTCATETVACADPHDIANTYGWTATGSAFDGSVVSVFLAQLNDRCDADVSMPCDSDSDCAGVGGACGFAGHRDWRLPNIKELLTRADYGAASGIHAAFAGASCGPACTDIADPACSCNDNSWSSTTGNSIGTAWCASGGKPASCDKLVYLQMQIHVRFQTARAVRGGF
jgi:hypothetical protein